MWLYYKSMFDIAKKVLLVLAVYTAIVAIFTFTASKHKFVVNQQAIIESNRAQIFKFITDKNLKASSEGRILIALFRSFSCSSLGEACTNNPSDGDRNYQYSATGYMAQLISLPLKNPVASGVYWARSSLENTGFIPRSYAAEGVGAAGLKPIAQIWILFRDLAYLVMVLVITTIGFLIMFRRKINAQTVVSLENSLPRIVISFILITFSFAIAGLLIDLMYMSIFIIIGFLGTNTIAPFDAAVVKSQALNGGFTLWDQVMWNGNYWKVGNAILALMPNQINIILRSIASISLIFLVSKIPIIGNIYSGKVLSNVVGVEFIIHAIMILLSAPIFFIIAPMFISVIFFLTALFVFFKIFFMLFKNYLTILLLVIFSPVILLLEAFPGQKAFGNWLKQLVAALLAFPITVALIMLSGIIVAIPSSMGSSGKPIALWAPPMLYSSYVLPDAFSVLVGVGILFMIPNIIQSLRKTLGIKDGVLSGAGIGMFFGGTAAVAGSGMGGLNKFTSIKYGIGGFIDPEKGGLIGKLLGTKGQGHGPPSVGH